MQTLPRTKLWDFFVTDCFLRLLHEEWNYEELPLFHSIDVIFFSACCHRRNLNLFSDLHHLVLFIINNSNAICHLKTLCYYPLRFMQGSVLLMNHRHRVRQVHAFVILVNAKFMNQVQWTAKHQRRSQSEERLMQRREVLNMQASVCSSRIMLEKCRDKLTEKALQA